MTTDALRVLHVTTVHPPFDVRIFHKEVRSLAASGISVGLATTVTQPEIHDGIPLVALGSSEGPRWRRIVRDLRAFRTIYAHRQAIVHIHDPELLLVAALPALMGARVVYDVHEFYVERIGSSHWIPGPLRRFATWAYDTIERLVLPRFAGVVIVSEAMRERYAGIVNPERIALVRNFPNLDATELERARHSSHPLEGRPYAIHTGGASRLRAFHTIVAAAEELKAMGSPLTIVNLGPTDLSDYEPAEAAQLLERARNAGIIMPGRVSYEESQRWMAHATAGYLPLADTENNRRGMPNKLFEYLLFGLPVVATRIGRVADIVGTTQAGTLVPFEAPSEHAAALAALAQHAALHQRFAAASTRAARAYSFDGEFDALETLYARIGEVA